MYTHIVYFHALLSGSKILTTNFYHQILIIDTNNFVWQADGWLIFRKDSLNSFAYLSITEWLTIVAVLNVVK